MSTASSNPITNLVPSLVAEGRHTLLLLIPMFSLALLTAPRVCWWNIVYGPGDIPWTPRGRVGIRGSGGRLDGWTNAMAIAPRPLAVMCLLGFYPPCSAGCTDEEPYDTTGTSVPAIERQWSAGVWMHCRLRVSYELLIAGMYEIIGLEGDFEGST